MGHVPLILLSELREIPSGHVVAERRLDESSHIGVVEIARVA
jgi:hypothetical protein